ncbi:hypothetical protein [Methylovirgula sp. HY1]|uniref:hypothetical protein n=1 Tax=Methylovirgula sp. HY1 TaxID=2822761 RepID=UPI001C5AA5FF|nr:hypothetical protein [Methylovirgula sp. HY1]QXX74242.1 hypothetical protein MHY1_01052 [Methylovirgula sp. HY1]
MDNPGALQFTQNGGAFQIGAPATATSDPTSGCDLAGITALTLQFAFKFGSGSGTVTAYVQTSLDQGQSWIDIAAVQFTNASSTQIVNLSGLVPQTTPLTPTQGTLAAGTCVDGVLGDRVQAVVVTTGAYQNSLLNLTGVAR